MTKTTKILTLLALTALVMGAIASPALAREHDDEDGSDRPGRDARPDQAERKSDRQEAKSDRPERHIAERCKDAANSTDEIPAACKRIAKSMGALARCRAAAADNSTDDNSSKLPSSCDRLLEVHDGEHKARRAAHAIIKAIDALEHRVARLEMKEMKIQEQLDEGNLTVENATKAQDRIDRIQEAQDKALERIEHLEARLEAIKERWDGAREHADAQKEKREKAHGDHHDDEEHEAESEDEEEDEASASSGNSTADPAP